jgi:anoctamin-10
MPSSSEGLTPQKIPYFTDISWKIYNLKFALLDSSQPFTMTKSQAFQSNLDVDYVISYRFAKTGMRHVDTLNVIGS